MEPEKSLPAWGVWIEMSSQNTRGIEGRRSLPAWGVWIEIREDARIAARIDVAPRMGSVD